MGKTLDKIKKANRIFGFLVVGVVSILLSILYAPVYLSEIYALIKGISEFNLNYYFEGDPLSPSDFAIINIKR